MWNWIRVKRLLRRPVELAWLHILTHISTHFNQFWCISNRFKRFRFISAHFQRLRLDKKFLESAHLGASIFIWLMGNRFINQFLKQICVAELILLYVWWRARQHLERIHLLRSELDFWYLFRLRAVLVIHHLVFLHIDIILRNFTKFFHLSYIL